MDLECTVFGYYLDMASILWHYIMLHCIALHWHMELCREPMVPTVPVQHRLLGTTMQLHTLLGMKAGVHMHTSLVWHRDAASYLDGYEGRRSCAFICISVWFWELDVRKYIAIYCE